MSEIGDPDHPEDRPKLFPVPQPDQLGEHVPEPVYDERKEHLRSEALWISNSLAQYGHRMIMDLSKRVHPAAYFRPPDIEVMHAQQGWRSAYYGLLHLQLTDEDAMFVLPNEPMHSFEIDQSRVGFDVVEYLDEVPADVPLRLCSGDNQAMVVRLRQKMRRLLQPEARRINDLTTSRATPTDHVFVCVSDGVEEPFYIHLDELAIKRATGSEIYLN